MISMIFKIVSIIGSSISMAPLKIVYSAKLHTYNKKMAGKALMWQNKTAEPHINIF